MKLPDKNRPAPDKNSPEYIIAKYNAARANLMLAIAFTVMNIGMYLIGSDTYFLFSMFLPYSLFGSGTVLSIVAVLLLAAYVLCYFMSKNKKGWLTAALVMFIIDTLAFAGLIVLVAMSGDFATIGSSLFDIIFHVWVLISLISGVKYGKRLEDAKAQIEAGQTAVSIETPTDVE